MKVELPPRLYRARTVRVKSYNCITAEIELGYGVSVKKNLVLEGIQQSDIPSHHRQAAKHALVVLAGGKDLIVHVDDLQSEDGYLPARVYLSEKVHGSPEGMATPFGLDVELLEISLFYRWLHKNGFNIQDVKLVLNGKGK